MKAEVPEWRAPLESKLISWPNPEWWSKHTLKFFAAIIRMSAGILSPFFTSMMSPTTSSSAWMLSRSPFLITMANWNMHRETRAVIWSFKQVLETLSQLETASKQILQSLGLVGGWLSLSWLSFMVCCLGSVLGPESRSKRMFWLHLLIQWQMIDNKCSRHNKNINFWS